MNEQKCKQIKCMQRRIALNNWEQVPELSACTTSETMHLSVVHNGTLFLRLLRFQGGLLQFTPVRRVNTLMLSALFSIISIRFSLSLLLPVTRSAVLLPFSTWICQASFAYWVCRSTGPESSRMLKVQIKCYSGKWQSTSTAERCIAAIN